MQTDPFLDKQGIIGVGSKLAESTIPFESKHPSVLPADYCITQNC